ncbi:MAG: serine/threonine protein kinase [Gammaproteobacteria bacterium]
MNHAESVAAHPVTLKQDLFGTVTRVERDGAVRVVRDCSTARWWLRGLARHLLARERRALQHLAGVDRVPRLLATERSRLEREWIDGRPMQLAQPRDPRYFREALRLVRRLHARDVTHDDLAKEPNWLVTPEGLPAVVDFQLARHAPRRGRLFRMLAHDDLRHWAKHKRQYLPERLTVRQRALLATPSPLSRAWRATVKPVYRFVTRRLLGWADREGAGDRRLDP